MLQLSSIIANTNSWEDFESALLDLPNTEKGRLFEEFTKLYFQYYPAYKLEYDNIWLLDEVPDAVLRHLDISDKDLGIDLVAESKGEYHAIQCKYHGTPERNVQFKEVSTFLSYYNSRYKFTHAIICSNANDLSKNLIQVINQGKSVTSILAEQFTGMSQELFDAIKGKIEEKEVDLVPFQPRPHQQKAINDAIQYFVEERKDRGKLIFPCGSGKSLTGYWIAEALQANSVLVAVPSLALVKQTLEVYLREVSAKRESVEWLCVCSDAGIGKSDDVLYHTYNLGVPCTTDIDRIADWLKENRGKRSIVFTTYQSGETIAIASRSAQFEFELGVFDEAHKTVGVKNGKFTTLLDNKNVEIQRRVYMTATERFYRGKKDHVYSMDDNSVFGQVFTQLSFKSAITQELLTDYRLVVMEVTHREVEALAKERQNLLFQETEIDFRTLASMLALRKATEKFNINHTLSFHSTIQRAKLSSELQEKLSDQFPKQGLATYFVSGKMPTSIRARKIKDFKKDQMALMTNARCLTEGVDVPDIDSIVFTDPRKSKVDIVQALGRALRKKDGKDYGYIILPLIIDDDENPDLESYEEILTIIRNLATNDERIIDLIRDKVDGSLPKTWHVQDELILYDTPTVDVNQLQESIELRVWDRLKLLQWRPFLEARKFAHSLGLKSAKQWFQLSKSEQLPMDIPSAPNISYNGKGWKNWGDWLGTGRVANYNIVYRPFKEAREFAISLGLRESREWREYAKSGDKPQDIPAKPERTYQDDGWAGYGDWLGTGRIKPEGDHFLPFEEARQIIHSYNIKSSSEWINQFKSSARRPDNIPATPQKVYKEKGWKGWDDWLGKSHSRSYLEFEKARDFARRLNFKSIAEWKRFCKSGTKPDHIPSTPHTVYLKDGWKGWDDWLDAQIIAPQDKNFLPYSVARAKVIKLGLKSQREWNEFKRKQGFPKGVPRTPQIVYKDNGWVSWWEWLGNK